MSLPLLLLALSGPVLAQDGLVAGTAALPAPTRHVIAKPGDDVMAAEMRAEVQLESIDQMRAHMRMALSNESCAGALAHAREILETVPDDLDALHAIATCTESDAGGDNTAVEIIQNSRILSLLPYLAEKAQIKDAIPILREVETGGSDVVAGHLTMSDLYEKLGQPEMQAKELAAAMAADPDDPRPKLLMAHKKFDDGDRAGARALYRSYLFSPRWNHGEAYLATYVAAMAYPGAVLPVLVALCWGLGAIAIRRRRREGIDFVWNELEKGLVWKIVPLVLVGVPVALALAFWITGLAFPYAGLIFLVLAEAGVLLAPLAMRLLRWPLGVTKWVFGSLFSTRFARLIEKVPSGWRILIAIGTLFVMGTLVPTIPLADARYLLWVLCGLSFFGTVGSLVVSFLRNSKSLRTSLRWLGATATLPFLMVYVISHWDELGTPLAHARLPDAHDVEDLLKYVVLWGASVWFALHLSKILADALTHPVKVMMSGVADIEHGNFKARVPVESKDEIGSLAEAVNRMAQGLERRELVERVFRQYHDKTVAERILSSGGQLPSQRMHAVVLFSDIRGFTRMSEKLSPEQVVGILNEYFEKMVAVITAHDGHIDKFIGDAIMAFWGVPEADPEGEKKAVRAALGMRTAMDELNEKFEREGHPKIGVGIGINAGFVVAGNLGAKDRTEYTIIGDVVNTAQRGESNAMAQQILVTEAVHKAVADVVDADALEGRLVKGKSEPVYFWSVRKLKGQETGAHPVAQAAKSGT